MDALVPRPSQLEERLFAQARDGHFGHFSLLEAGLIAGGVQREDELHRYCHHFDALVDSLRASGKVRGEPRKQAEVLFAFLHRKLLHGGYCLQASDMREAFEHGRFNCVTASLLLKCLAERFHIQATALALPGHALTRLKLPGETLDVETTCSEWLKRAETRHLPDTKPQAVTDIELVAMLYYNRGVDLLGEREFAAATAANLKAIRLDSKNKAARGNCLATINNWGIDRAVAGDYSMAAKLFRLGMAADPSYAAFHDNYIRLYRQWTDQLCRSGREEEAIRLLNQIVYERPDEPFFREMAIELRRRPSERLSEDSGAVLGDPAIVLPTATPEY